MHHIKKSFPIIMCFVVVFLISGCATASVTAEEITADFLMALIAAWGVLGIVIAIIGLILTILWMLVPFFVWRIARHNKRTTSRTLQVANSLVRLESTAARLEKSVREMSSSGNRDSL